MVAENVTDRVVADRALKASEERYRLATEAVRGLVYDYDIPVISVGLRNVPQRVAALVRERLWEEVPNGWHVRSWAKWNLSQSELAENKLKRQEAAARTNHSLGRHQVNPDDNCPVCQGGAA